MANFATVADVTTLWRTLTTDETLRAEALLAVVSDTLRLEAEKVGKDLDQSIIDSVSYASVLKAITVDIIARTLMTPTTVNRWYKKANQHLVTLGLVLI